MKLPIRDQISFSVFNEADHSSKQFTVSRAVFLLTVLSVSAAVCLTGFIAIRCSTLNDTIPAKALLEEAGSSQRHLILSQTRQINLLNKKLNSLREKFKQLQDIRNEICQIGRIEQPVHHENLFGIGGSLAESRTRAAEANNDGISNEIGTNSDPNKDHEKIIIFDPARFTDGRMRVLDHSDFHINPIACIPLSLPMNGKIADELQQSGQLISRQNNAHQGILLRTVQGEEIMAPANGIITFIDFKKNNNIGKTVVIDHGHGYITRYACLKSVTKELGEIVFKGEVIGHAKTGTAETPSQFYYEIMLNGLPVNPEKYITHDPFLL